MPKAKPISLHPLTFDEAMKVLVNVNPKPKKKRSVKKLRKHKR